MSSPTNALATQADPTNYQAYLDSVLARQQNTTGLTQVGPSVPHYQVPGITPAQQQRTDNAPQPVGPGQGGAVKRAEMKNLGASISNAVTMLVQKHQEREQRSQQQVFDNFSSAAAGLQAASGQIREAQDALNNAAQKLKANPQDQQARDEYMKAGQSLQQAQSAKAQNVQVLEDMASDPKKRKMLAKGYGIDDKNASTPERQAAIAAIRKQQGVGQNTAGIMSQLPQTMQLSPQAQAQQMARQAGVLGKPSTGGQDQQYEMNKAKLAQNQEFKTAAALQNAEKIANKAGQDTSKMIAALPGLGLQAEHDADGNVKRAPDGTIVTRNLTREELTGNPVLAARYQEMQTKINLQVAQAKATQVRAQVAQMAEARKASEKAQASDPGTVSNWARLVSDPSSGVTLKDVPSAARNAVISSVAGSGKTISKPLTSDELKRADLAGNAVNNLAVAQEILKNRPDMFGPAGWGKTKFEMALSGGDPDAVKFLSAITLANLPLIGIHGVRGKWAAGDLEKLDGNLYLNADSMGNVLTEASRSASEFEKMGGRRQQETSPQVSGGADPLGILK
jgi:hypothetical protein